MSESMETAGRLTRPGVQPGHHSALRAGARVLLAHILAQIDWYRDAPLTFEVDHDGIAAEAWKSFSAEWIISHSEDVPSWEEMLPILDELAASLLNENAPAALSGGAIDRPEREARAGSWVDRLQLAVRSADAHGPKILRLLAEGFQCRDVARRLELGLQMTRRIVADIRTAWLGRDPRPDASC